MGASGWDYVQPFDTDLATTLTNLRRRVFEEEDFSWYDSIPKPATLADLDALLADDPMDGEPDFDSPAFQQLIDVAITGTHSILDARTLGPRGDIQPLTEQQALQLFGTCSPTAAVFEETDLNEMSAQGWTGYCVRLHDDSGAVTAIGFWGASGD